MKINNKCHTLSRQPGNHRNDLNLSNTSGEEEKAALICSSTHSNSPSNAANQNMASPASSSSSKNAMSNHTDSTSATLSTSYAKSATLNSQKIGNTNIINNQLSVLVNNSVGKQAGKCIVASTESLTSINTDNSSKIAKQSNENTTMTTSSPQESVSSRASSSDNNSTNVSNFKTFKNAQVLNSPQQPKYQPHANQLNILTEAPNPYKTLPNGGSYRQNYVDFSQQQQQVEPHVTRVPSQRTHQLKKPSMLDQKQLNLPVNELFKRYELKRQAAAGSLSSSGSLTDLNTAGLPQQATTVKQQQQPTNNTAKNQSISTFVTSPRLNRVNLSSATNQIPDYFFKDEREHKKFNSGKQMINLTHVDINCDN
jgi:hypothetical protein